MSIHERLKGVLEGGPGPIVDEAVSESGKSYIYYAYYDENGDIRYYMDFQRDISPEEISWWLDDFAKELLLSYMDGLTLEEAIEKAEELKEQAKNVPGLHNK